MSNTPKSLYIMRGPSGCGKSQFAAEHFPPEAIVTPDEIRFAMTATPYHHASDTERKVFETAVWNEVFRRITALMDQGAPNICFDATNCRTGHLPQYEALATAHGYAIYVIDMTDVPFEECLKRNAERRGQRRVPFKVIEHQINDAIMHPVPTTITVLTPVQAAALLSEDESAPIACGTQ